MVDESTGVFNKEGNIYDDLHIFDEKLVSVVKANPPVLGAREDVYIAASKKVKRGELNLEPKAWVCRRKLPEIQLIFRC